MPNQACRFTPLLLDTQMLLWPWIISPLREREGEDSLGDVMYASWKSANPPDEAVAK